MGLKQVGGRHWQLASSQQQAAGANRPLQRPCPVTALSPWAAVALEPKDWWPGNFLGSECPPSPELPQVRADSTRPRWGPTLGPEEKFTDEGQDLRMLEPGSLFTLLNDPRMPERW